MLFCSASSNIIFNWTVSFFSSSISVLYGNNSAWQKICQRLYGWVSHPLNLVCYSVYWQIKSSLIKINRYRLQLMACPSSNGLFALFGCFCLFFGILLRLLLLRLFLLLFSLRFSLRFYLRSLPRLRKKSLLIIFWLLFQIQFRRQIEGELNENIRKN